MQICTFIMQRAVQLQQGQPPSSPLHPGLPRLSCLALLLWFHSSSSSFSVILLRLSSILESSPVLFSSSLLVVSCKVPASRLLSLLSLHLPQSFIIAFQTRYALYQNPSLLTFCLPLILHSRLFHWIVALRCLLPPQPHLAIDDRLVFTFNIRQAL